MSKKLFGKLFVFLLVVGLLFAVAPTGQAQAQSTLCVNTDGSGGCYTSIQDAITAAVAGDTITVAAGIYHVPTTITLDKAISIIGPTTGEAKVIGTGTDMFKVFAITSSNVTIKDLEITLAVTPASPLLISDELNSSLISISGGAGMTGIIIQGNEIYVPVQTPPMTGWTARALTVGSNTVSGMVISGNTVYNTRNGIVIQGNNSATITGNTIYNTKGGIMNYTVTAEDAAARVMTNNSWGTVHNEWDIVWNSGGGPYVMDMDKYVLQLSTAQSDARVVSLMTTGVFAELTGNRSHVYVNAVTGIETLHPANGNVNLPYKKIKDAIDAVVPGGKVYVAAGTYAEQLTINKAVTLLGPNAAVAGDGTRVEEAILTFPDGLTDIGSSLLTVNSDRVTVAGLKFQDKAYIQPLYPIHIYTLGANNLTVKNNLFIGGDIPIYRDPYVNAINPDNTGWLIENNKFVGGPFVNSEIARAMYIYKTGATIQNNVIEGYGVGIQILPATAAIGGEVKNNTIAAGHIGLYHNGHDKGAGAWTYSGNTITVAPNDRAANQGIYDPIAVDATVNFRAIQITNFGQGGTGDLPTVTFSNNVADLQPEATSSLADKIAVRLNLTSAAGTAVTLEKNSFVNYTVAVRNETVTAVDASPNWWGSATGPAAGQMVGDVSYIPWCANAACTEFLPAAVTIAPVDPIVCGNVTTSTIDINVAGIPTATPLQGYEFRLHFDETLTSIANLTTDPIDIVNGGFIEDGGFFVINYIDETTGLIVTGPTGIVDISYAQLYPSTSMGDGLLASITLTHLGVPGDIELLLSDVVLSDRDAYVIPSEASATATTLTLNPAVLNTTKEPDAGYCDLGSAVAAASAGDTLQLQADITIPTTVTVDKALTLDLNGKVATIPTGGYGLDVTSTAGNLTITDSSAGASGVITGGYNTVWVGGGATFTLDKGSLTGALYGVGVVGTGSTVNVDGGVIDSVYFAITGNGSAGYGGTIIDIDGGAISSDYTAIYVPQAGSVDISAGTISGHTGIEVRSGSLTISGGSITATGQYLPVPGTYSDGSLESGDAIFINTNPDYAGNMIINISGGTFTSATGYAMREYVYDSAGVTEVETLTVTGGTFIGGVDSGEAGAAVTFSTQLTALQLPELALKGGLYNTDPASPTVFVFVPYGTVFNTTEQMYEIVGISLNVHDFYYASYDTGHGILLGVSTDFYATNFVFSDAISVTVNLYSGSEGAYVLQQTNELKDPGAHPGDVLTSSFDIFGTYVSNSWTNTKPVDEYGQTVAPTRVEVIVVLPGGTLTGYNYLLTGDRDTILPDISGTIKLQGRSEFASVPLYLTAGEVVISTTTTGLLGEFTFDAVEGYEYTFTTLQPRYLNLTLDSAKLILADKSKTLPVLQLRGGNAVWMNSETETNDIIDINDASLVGGQYGTAGANAGFGNHGDCNFDGKVNVQDLALVGGNFDFQSYDPDNTVYPFAYTAWLQ